MATNKKKIKRLIDLMNDRSGFRIPPLPPVVRCFELAMDDDILEFLLRVGSAEHTVENLQSLYSTMRATGELSDKRTFDELWRDVKGMAFMMPCADGARYELSPIFPGWLEMGTAGPISDKNDAILEEFGNFWKYLALFKIPPLRDHANAKDTKRRDEGAMRMTTLTSVTPAGKPSKKRVVVNEPLESEQEVLTQGNVFDILDRNKDQIAVMNCICRRHRQIESGHDCDKGFPLQSCMPIGNLADMLVEAGIADRISHEDAVELMKDLERKGCIHTTFHRYNDASTDELAICNCCLDCCLLLGSPRKGYRSMIQVKALNKPEVVCAENCSGCNKCGKSCPTTAIRYDKESGELKFDYESCIGCGQCVTQCRFSVQKMVPDERAVFVKTIKAGASHA